MGAAAETLTARAKAVHLPYGEYMSCDLSTVPVERLREVVVDGGLDAYPQTNGIVEELIARDDERHGVMEKIKSFEAAPASIQAPEWLGEDTPLTDESTSEPFAKADLDDMTIHQLRLYATKHNITLGDANRKDEIVAKITKEMKAR